MDVVREIHSFGTSAQGWFAGFTHNTYHDGFLDFHDGQFLIVLGKCELF